MQTTTRLDDDRLARLVALGRALTAELDLDAVLDMVLVAARELTGARYAALGVLDDGRHRLGRFLTGGLDDETRRAIGSLPTGKGLLGVLIEDPRPLRLDDVAEHPRSYGFPPGHPPMETFLGVPILIRGNAWGNLYLCDKELGGPFTAVDEETVVVLADWASVAVQNARLYEDAVARSDELQRAVRGLEATAAIARAIGGETELGRVLELVAKRARALVGARDVLILLREGDHLVARAAAGEVELCEHRSLPLEGSTTGQVLRERRSQRITDVASEMRVSPSQLGVRDVRTALIVPLVYRGDALGALIAFERVGPVRRFTADDELLLEAFADQSATAVAAAKSVEQDRLRRSIEAAEEERRRWARELHDETLQALGALRVLLSGAARLQDPAALRAAVAAATEQLTSDIASLRGIIAELRPAALDQLGLAPALSSLAQRTMAASGLDVQTDVDLGEHALTPELETTVYRIVQESLTNAARHAGAERVAVRVRCDGHELAIAVVDDGGGFDPAAASHGYGLHGIRERVELAGGELQVGPGERSGTAVRATLPLR
ncbi:MAG TPA: GAF domain-containing sensor histidine kinase [Solirubrobacteraceae bacterium]|nr:GAF domain-containing sensor histidine kinase [Solirubrobacteraceae bacterium]